MPKPLLLLIAVLVALLPAGEAPAATHVVNMVGLTFSPDSLTIDAGDTVQWVYPVSVHTVTNGTGPTDPQVGMLFDHSGSAGLIFEYTFNDAGEFPYFCRPHFSLGMTGNVTVLAPTPAPGEVRTESWGNVKGAFRDGVEAPGGE